MSWSKGLEAYRGDIERCVKCGACRAHCPVFGVEKQEGRVARGKIALADALLNGAVDLEASLLLDISQCLLCGSCYAQCPNNVPTEEIVAAVRREIARRQGLPAFVKGVAAILERQDMVDLVAKSSGLLSRLLFKKVPEESGLRLRFSLPAIHPDRTLPAVATTPFRQRCPELLTGENGKPVVLFFTGCGINYLYPQSGEALLKALKFMGVTVLVPRNQACCGLPAVSAGAADTVGNLAEKNMALFRRHRYDAIVTACASCHSALSRVYPKMDGRPDAVKGPIKDIFAFLVEQGLIETLAQLPKAHHPVRVTYHAPCHLRNFGKTTASRAILNALPQIELVEMESAGSCCGLGGSYSLYHYDTSRKIGAKKAQWIVRSGADLVATDCPGCIVQLQDSLNQAGGKQRAVHLLDLVAAALP